MKKLAINSFLAVTAVAWMGQPSQVQANSSQWRDANGRGDIGSSRSRVEAVLTLDDTDPGLQFSTHDRVLLVEWLTHRPRSTAVRPGIQRGDKLGHVYPGNTSRLPADISEKLSNTGGTTLDLVIAEQVVRIMRNSRRVIDTVNA